MQVGQYSGVAILCPGRKPVILLDDIDWSAFNTKSRGALDATLFGVTPPSTPNRLCGATINDDGDAT